jgi:hypothetical protein
MGPVKRRLNYANVIATVALFLALGGGVVWAGGKIGAKGLKANAVTAGKIKRNAVTNVKIRANAVTGPKIKNGAVSFAKLAAGANLVAAAAGGPVPASGGAPLSVPLAGTASFTPQAGTLYLLSVEAKGGELKRVGTEPCEPTVVPFVNGSAWAVGEGTLRLRAFTPTPDEPTGLVPLAGATGPVGLTSPGVAQTVAAKVIGDSDCTSASTVSVGIAVTQSK